MRAQRHKLSSMSLGSLLNGVVYAIVGLLVFAAAVSVLARALPGDLWTRAVRDKEVAPAIVVAAIVLALGWIVAAAVH